MKVKEKVRIKVRLIHIDIFSNQILLESVDYLFYFIHIKMAILKDLMFETNIYQNAKSKIITLRL